MKECKVLIIGCGASGLMCALRLKDKHIKFIALDKNDRVGRKLSATGNGQGNITNIHVSEKNYFSGDAEKVKKVLQRFGYQNLLNYFETLGGIFVHDEEGRIYPASKQAASVTDIMRFELLRDSAELRLSETVVSAKKMGNTFIVRSDKNEYSCDYLVLANGGCASPHFGSDGSGYRLAQAFGHTVTPLAPSLVQLKTELPPIKGLKGVRCECVVTLCRAGKAVLRTSGDLIFTDYGVSGNAIFKLSSYAKKGDSISVDFLPQIGADSLYEKLKNKISRFPDLPAEDILRCILNSAVGKAVLRYCGIKSFEPFADCGTELRRFTDSVKNFRLEITGSMGFTHAQVTKGGVDLHELNDNMMSKKVKNLYIVGELADVDGECGGYNLQWAFSSAFVAAESIAKDMANENR